MTDIKTIMSWLEGLAKPDWRMYFSDSEVQTIAKETLDLLKAQEAVKPIPPEDEFSLYRCGKCYHQLFRCVDKYCSRCGKAVKWK